VMMSLADVLTSSCIPDLTGEIIKDDRYSVTPGAIWDVWMCQWQFPPEYPPVSLCTTINTT